jgi:uncharacterized protein YndB with AHSA1/START domain
MLPRLAADQETAPVSPANDFASDRTFRTQRVIPHTPTAVFAAIADPTRLARWWGPNGFTNIFESFEFTVGGRWTFVMQGGGKQYPNQNVFRVIEPESRVVIEHVSPPHFTLTVTLKAQDHGTLVTWAQEFDDVGTVAAIRHVVEPANEQNLDRWQAVLAEDPPQEHSR